MSMQDARNGASDQTLLYLDILRDIVSQPTAPFHKERVAARASKLPPMPYRMAID